jgi:hypothetical protein
VRIISLCDDEVSFLEELLDLAMENAKTEEHGHPDTREKDFWRRRYSIALAIDVKLFPQTFATTAHELKRLLRDPGMARAMTSALEQYMQKLEDDNERQAIYPLYELAKAQAQGLAHTLDLQLDHQERDAELRKR